MAARSDGFVHFFEHFLQLLLGERAFLQLLGHFFEGLYRRFGLAFVQLLREVFAQLRLLLLEFLERLGHRLHFFQVNLRHLQILEELVDLAVLQRFDGLVQARQ